MTPRHPLALALQRLALRSGRTRLARRVWAAAFRLAGRAAGAYLTRDESGASVYARGGADEDFLPGLSDIDLAVILEGDPAGPGNARARVAKRWERLRRLPAVTLVLDWPRIHEEAELRDLAGPSVLTYGLDGDDRASPAGLDASRMLGRPGTYASTADWRLLSGADRRPAEPERDEQDRRVAAWLELVYWWRLVFPVCIEPVGPRAADLCVKFVAEPARIWLWLAHGERTSGRIDALERALRRLPDEEDAIRRALALHRSLPDGPEPPLDEVLPAMLRLSGRIAELLVADVADTGSVQVRLAGADPAELILADGGWTRDRALAGGEEPTLVPLADWRALALPQLPDESLAFLPDDARDPNVLGAAAASQPAGPHPALRAGELIVLPGTPWERNRLRAIQCRLTDPVSFALSDGARVAAFPAVRGWSAEDTARRAVAEHRARLAGAQAGGRALATLFTAIRAALFLDSIRDGEPELALTATETARRLAGRSPADRAVAEEALGAYRDFALSGAEPPERTVSALRHLAIGLPAYAADRPVVRAHTA